MVRFICLNGNDKKSTPLWVLRPIWNWGKVHKSVLFFHAQKRRTQKRREVRFLWKKSTLFSFFWRSKKTMVKKDWDKVYFSFIRTNEWSVFLSFLRSVGVALFAHRRLSFSLNNQFFLSFMRTVGVAFFAHRRLSFSLLRSALSCSDKFSSAWNIVGYLKKKARGERGSKIVLRKK